MTEKPTFNLLDEPWILCIDSSDAPVALSIRDIFSGRGDAQKVLGDSPTQDYAVIRVLLAIFGGPMLWISLVPIRTILGGLILIGENGSLISEKP